MIEIVEAVVLARQFNRELQGKRIVEGGQGNSPHKFAFVSGSAEEYSAILPDKVIGEASEHGSVIKVRLEPGYALLLGEGGERIRYHRDASTLPNKYQFWLAFEDGGCLTVSIQGWGATMLLPADQVDGHSMMQPGRVSPLSAAFTREYFEGLFGQLTPEDKTSLKAFMITKPKVWGVGNGYLQDILFRAGMHPRRKAVSLAAAERDALYEATVETLRTAVELGGRDTEFDLFDQPGGYVKLLDARSVGQPCVNCETPIEKESYMGGTVYFCPQCQKL